MFKVRLGRLKADPIYACIASQPMGSIAASSLLFTTPHHTSGSFVQLFSFIGARHRIEPFAEKVQLNSTWSVIWARVTIGAHGGNLTYTRASVATVLSLRRLSLPVKLASLQAHRYETGRVYSGEAENSSFTRSTFTISKMQHSPLLFLLPRGLSQTQKP